MDVWVKRPDGTTSTGTLWPGGEGSGWTKVRIVEHQRKVMSLGDRVSGSRSWSWWSSIFR